MKNIVIITLVFLLVSCNNEETDNLQKRIAELEATNKKLQDSLNNIERDKIISSSLILIPQEEKMRSQETNKFTGIFFQDVNFPKYNVYEVFTDSDGEKQRKLIREGVTDSKFQYEFTPTSKTDNQIELIAEFEKDTLKNEKLEIYTKTVLNVE